MKDYTCKACTAAYAVEELLVRGVLLPPGPTYKCPNCGARLEFYPPMLKLVKEALKARLLGEGPPGYIAA